MNNPGTTATHQPPGRTEPGSAPQPPPAAETPFLTRVAVTGATGFVGRQVVRELVARGHRPVCLVRDRERFLEQARSLGEERLEAVGGDLFDDQALQEVTTGSEAVIHLVGIIFEHPLRGQTFQRIHVEATRRMLDAARAAGIRRFLHMSALGTRPRAVSEYHRTKWAAEGLVRESGLDWTIFRPSIIHGPDGEFMRMMRRMVCHATLPMLGVLPAPFPILPYFGDGQNRVQPVSVRDVAHCFVAALSRPETIGQVYALGGPEAMSWKELYRACREAFPGAKKWKPVVGQPVWAAKLMAMTLMKLPLLPAMMRFNVGQVEMSQEDSVCDISPVEETFAVQLRDFRTELAGYAAMVE
jgi:NADH dehydrogenase